MERWGQRGRRRADVSHPRRVNVLSPMSAAAELATTTDRVDPTADAVLAQDALDMRLHRVGRDVQLGGDLVGRAHLGNQLQDLGLPLGEGFERAFCRRAPGVDASRLVGGYAAK